MSEDSLSILNAYMLENKMRFPLIIDPTGNVYNFIKNMLSNKLAKLQNVNSEKGGSGGSSVILLEKRNHDTSFKSSFKAAMEFGHNMLVSSCEQPNMVLSSLISTGIDTSYSRPIQMFKEKLSIDPNFDMYMFVSTSDLKFAPYLASKIMVVDFSINNAYIENTIRIEILKSEEFSIYEQVITTSEKIELSKDQQEMNKRNLLNILKNTDDILDNLDVIKTLQLIQDEYKKTDERREVLENEFENFQSKIKGYSNLAKKVIKIWFLLENLNLCDSL